MLLLPKIQDKLDEREITKLKKKIEQMEQFKEDLLEQNKFFQEERKKFGVYDYEGMKRLGGIAPKERKKIKFKMINNE